MDIEQQLLDDQNVLTRRAHQFGLKHYNLTSFNHLLQEAKLAGPFEYSRMIYTLKNTGSMQDRQKVTQERIVEFFMNASGVNLTGYMGAKIQPNYSTCQILFDSLYLYGTDFMSTKRIVRYLGIYQPYKLEWINESSCKIVYQSPAKARKALLNNLRDPAILPLIGPEQFIIDDQHQPYLQNRLIEDHQLYELKPYFELGFERRIMCRYATTQDVRNPFRKMTDKFNDYLVAKQYFMRNRDSLREEVKYHGRIKEVRAPIRYNRNKR